MAAILAAGVEKEIPFFFIREDNALAVCFKHRQDAEGAYFCEDNKTLICAYVKGVGRATGEKGMASGFVQVFVIDRHY